MIWRVIKIKNTVNTVVNEIRNWLENRGYMHRHIFVVNLVSIYLSTKISFEDIEDFKKEFGYEMRLEGASFDENGFEREFKYRAYHKMLEEFSSQIKEWLDNHSFPIRFYMIKEELSLHAYDKLSDEQIHDFEEEFEVRCNRYSISCNSNGIVYEFS